MWNNEKSWLIVRWNQLRPRVIKCPRTLREIKGKGAHFIFTVQRSFRYRAGGIAIYFAIFRREAKSFFAPQQVFMVLRESQAILHAISTISLLRPGKEISFIFEVLSFISTLSFSGT